MTNEINTHNGTNFKVTKLENAMVDANGRKLYLLEIEDWGENTIRAYNYDLAIVIAKEYIETEVE